MKLYSYVMTDDTGFAPNPYPPALTLATCKPGIRLRARPGDWVMAVTGKTTKFCKEQGRLVYLKEVAEVLTFEKYWRDHRFEPKKYGPNGIHRHGDNIYEPRGNSLTRNKRSPYHITSAEQDRDKRGRNVLIGKKNASFYFGKCGPKVCDERFIKKGPSYKIVNNYVNDREIKEFIKTIGREYRKHGNKFGEPHGGQ